MATVTSSGILLEDFGQKVDLTRRIREVLLNYPEGTTVLKELVQNADDAGATVVKLCVDRRVHGTSSLLSPVLSQFQTRPSLLAYNNAVFTESDFLSISRIGGSSKNSPRSWKTGRFGVGFNSVYHLTDIPSFVSSNYVVLFDPQLSFLPNVSSANPGKRIDFVKTNALRFYEDQFSPFIGFGCDMENHYSGTLFRFPLRSPAQAEISRLSRQAYGAEDVVSMFEQLFQEGAFALLFLKNVLSIEMYVWDDGDVQPIMLYSCRVRPVDETVVYHRQTLLRLSAEMESEERADTLDAFNINFCCEDVAAQTTKHDSFFVVQCMASGSSRISSFAKKVEQEYDMHLIPWGAVAARISANFDSDNYCDDMGAGRAFCFLPLPVTTGLRFHVNGYFEVASNRRGIWYGKDMDRSGKIRSIWNRLLLENIVSLCFKTLLMELRETLGPTKEYYSFWPVGSFEDPWKVLVEKVYREISEAPVMFSEVGAGKWVSPADAFLHDEGFVKSKELGVVLLKLNVPLVSLPPPLFDMVLKCTSAFQQKLVSPKAVRQILRSCVDLTLLNKSDKLVLLEYCLEDLVDTDVCVEACDLPLLPLANGGFGCFTVATTRTSPYFICDEIEYLLLERISDRLIDQDIPKNIHDRLFAIATSSTSNVNVFNIQHFVSLLSYMLPKEWKYKSKVLWDRDSHHDHPSLEWFELFWKYIHSHCENLPVFCDWPILPSTTGYVYRLSRQLKLLNCDGLSGLIQGILVNIGCTILNSSIGVAHPDLHFFVYDSNCIGVLNCISDTIASDGLQAAFNNLSTLEKDELRNYLLDPKWYIGGAVDASLIKKCKRFPIYRIHGRIPDQTIHFAGLENPVKFLPPLGAPEQFLDCSFIDSSSSSEDDILLRYYGVERMRDTHFYRHHVFRNIKMMESAIRDGIMLSILEKLPQLCVEDISFKDAIRNIEFIPTSSGYTRSPSQLYDPRNIELCDLLEDSESFPSGVYRRPEILDMLCSLGLRTSVSPETMIESARQVETLMYEDQKKANYRGKVLLSFLEVNASKWTRQHSKYEEGKLSRIMSGASKAFKSCNMNTDHDKLWNELKMICWCPVMVAAPFQTVPWPVISSTVAPPKLVRLQSDLWLVSASMRLLDGECSSSSLAYNLGWLSSPGGSVIAAQLLELGKNNETVTDPSLRCELALAMPRIYSIMSSLLESDENEVMKAILEGSRWIWVGDGFATCEEVVLEGPLHLVPYMRVIPTDLAAFKELFLDFGVKEYCLPIDYANILNRMASRKGSSPLNSKELRAAILVVHNLDEVHLHIQGIKLYLPDISGRLFSASELVYNDAPWLFGQDDNETSHGFSSGLNFSAKRKAYRYVHGNISNEVAERLGVSSLRRILLAESADSMNVSLSGMSEAFGQHESLTTRLKHILEMYADGPGILFELIQNAEDAGASEVKFLLDKSQYATDSVLSLEMAEWQGPALYCYNDTVFSTQDLYAISRIGQESKLEKPFAIGRFGLGFNSVYHFTDVPVFVSGENIVMFDPHACNLPGISPSHPGLRIKFVGGNILEQFPDQFSPFLHFGCDLKSSFPGTLFRFPLRNSNTALRSQIRKEAYNPTEIMSLFDSFSNAISHAIIFLRNVKEVSIYVKEGNDDDMQLMHRVQKSSFDDSEVKPSRLNDVFSYIIDCQRGLLDKDQFLRKLRNVKDEGLPYRCQKIRVTEQKLSVCCSHMWMTGECIGRSDISLMNEMGRRSVPWGCVALNLQSVKMSMESTDISSLNDYCSFDGLEVMTTNSSERGFEGHAFCFLPLPISTGLPVHLNAYFELSSNRRDIWYGNDMVRGGKKRSDWNIHILEDILAPAYAHLLEKLAMEIGPCDFFFSCWPTSKGLEPWASMVRKLYLFVAQSDLKVLYSKAKGGHWISAKQALFPDFNYDRIEELVGALSDSGLPLVHISKPVGDRFMEVCPTLNFMTPALLRSLLARCKRGMKDKLSTIVTLGYCLRNLDVHLHPESLFGLPLLPMSDGSFSSFERHGTTSERVYIARGDEYSLLKYSIPHQLVDCDIPETVYSKLCYIAKGGKSNISFMSCTLLEKLFFSLLPPEWQLSKKVTWHPGISGHPTSEWIRLLWSYLKSNCDNLSIFSRWPILPVGDNYLMQLTPNSNVIMDDGWNENMSTFLLKVGCLFLRHDFSIEHQQLHNFVHPPTAVGVLNALVSIAGNLADIPSMVKGVSKRELHELRSFILQSKWFVEHEMSDVNINIIKFLPIFESYQSGELVCLNDGAKWLKPEDVREELLDDSFIRIQSERERGLMKEYLGIYEPSKAEFYTNYVLINMSKFISQSGVVSAVLCDIKHLLDDADVSVLSSIPFVMAADGSWKRPSSLYDPRVRGLQMLLYRHAFFPAIEFSDPESLDILVSLGLQRTLDCRGLVDSARSVQMMYDAGNPAAVSCGKYLLSCLDALTVQYSAEQVDARKSKRIIMCDNEQSITDDRCSSDLRYANSILSQDDLDMNIVLDSVNYEPDEEFWLLLQTIPWCPILSNSPISGFPWLCTESPLCSPNVVRPKQQMWVVSFSMHLLDGECKSIYLQEKLGWMKCPSMDVLSTQLIHLSKSYDLIKQGSSSKSDVVAALQEAIPQIYSKLEELVSSGNLVAVKQALFDVPWVWIGDDFVLPRLLAFDSPVKFTPYLYAVPSELHVFKGLLLRLGVRLSFDIWDYFHILERLNDDVKGVPLSEDQLCFVHLVLETVAELFDGTQASENTNTLLLLPDASGVLRYAAHVIYDDVPWVDNIAIVGKYYVHASIGNDLANRLGINMLSCFTLVDDDMTTNISCMEISKQKELLKVYGNNDSLVFDLLELADCCKARKLHVMFDKRKHSRVSLLQQNLGRFQGPALVAVLEGVSLSREEVSCLQLLPPWRLRGDTLNYGMGLQICYSVCELLTIVSGGYFYVFDPLSVAFGNSHSSTAKMFSLADTYLVQRFPDQFGPMLMGQDMPWSPSDSTIIRMPLSSECLQNDLELGLEKVRSIFDKFMEYASGTLIFLKSVVQVSLSTWDERSSMPCQEYSAYIDQKFAATRNPFSGNKWRKFQISSIFNSSCAATKSQVIDVNICYGTTRTIDRWLVVLSMGSGQTRNMALDRRYLAYSLTPVAGVAAHLSRDGQPSFDCGTGTIMSPLPLSAGTNLPITIFGCFLVCHTGGRFLFNRQDKRAISSSDPGYLLVEAWNRELMSCVRDSYVEMTIEMEKLIREPSTAQPNPIGGQEARLALKAYTDGMYHFWPKSYVSVSKHHLETTNHPEDTKILKVDCDFIVEQVVRPFYACVFGLPLWQLCSGNFVKCEDGMFLSNPGIVVGGSLLPATVCTFVKEHYPVFSVPWSLLTELKAAGVRVKEIGPKMVRDLLRTSSTFNVLHSVETYVDVLEYCLSDVELPSSPNTQGVDRVWETGNLSNNTSSSLGTSALNTYSSSTPRSSNSTDALEVVTNLGKALFDLGRVVVEDIGRAGGSRRDSIFENSFVDGNQRMLHLTHSLKGLPCITAAHNLVRFGVTELWLGNRDHQTLMISLASNFIHQSMLERTVISNIFSNAEVQALLMVKKFSLQLLSSNMKFLFHESWVSHVMNLNMTPWFSWDSISDSGGEDGPSPNWIRLFWKCFYGSSNDLSLFSAWPLIPAFLGRSILCRIEQRQVVFVPPLLESSDAQVMNSNNLSGMQPIDLAFEAVKSRYPWLYPLLNKWNIPIFDASFADCAASCDCVPILGQSLGQIVVSKLLLAKQAGYLPDLSSISTLERQELFKLLADNSVSNFSNYGDRELDVLRSLPIYKTISGSYTHLQGQDHFMVSSRSVLKASDDYCLSYSTDSTECAFLKALAVPELNDHQILVKFGLPGFENKLHNDQEDILIYIYTNWRELQSDCTLIQALRETKFVKSANEFSTELYLPTDMFDPHDALLVTVFSEESTKFPGERFCSDGWLNILRKTGLRNSSEMDVILDCARKVELLGIASMRSPSATTGLESTLVSSTGEVSLELWELAGSVVEAVLAKFALFYGNSFCDVFGSIACIPAEFGLPHVNPKRVLTSYAEAALVKDWPLAWSCSAIISKPNVIPPEYSWGALHLKSPPAFSTVLKHLQAFGKNGGEETLASWPAASGIITVVEASCEILKYLDKHWSTLSHSDINELRRVAFIPAANGTRLVMANSLFARLTVNLSPFSFELPTIYLPFVKTLRDLGLQDALSDSAAINLLKDLQKNCGYQRLNPNELRAVLEILHFLCDTSKDAGRMNWRTDAIVPDDGCRVVHANSCVYVDSNGCRYLNSIDTSVLRFVHPDVPKRISIFLGIKKLSDVVVEELVTDIPLQPLQSIDSLQLSVVRQKLLSRSFHGAVSSLAGMVSGFAPNFNDLPFESVRNILEHIADRLQFVKYIETRFLLLPKATDITRRTKDSIFSQWGDETKHRCVYFVDQSKSIILVAEPPVYMPVHDILSIVVSHILGSPLTLPLGSLFLCPTDSETAILDTVKLQSGYGDVSSASYYQVGKELLPPDSLQVQLHPLRPFYKGEIIAWRSQNGDKLKYGRVVDDCRPPSGQSLYRFNVETQPKSVESLLSSKVFSFKSTSLEASPIKIETLQAEKTFRDVPESSTSGSSQPESGRELSYGRVSASELVQAVREMLSAAGIDFDKDKQHLLKTTVILQERLQESQSALLSEQEKSDLATKEAEAAKTAWICRVCLTNEVDITIVPCGHVLCRRCSSAVPKCPFCRARVTEAIRIFRP